MLLKLSPSVFTDGVLFRLNSSWSFAFLKVSTKQHPLHHLPSRFVEYFRKKEKISFPISG